MACPPERYANLPIAPKYKDSLIAFCSDPTNATACDQLCKASDEEIIATVEKIAPQLEQWERDGIPDEIREAHPDLANELPQRSNRDDTPVNPGIVDQGIGALPKQINPSIPPGQLADVPMPMDVPSQSSSASSNVSYRNGGFVNARSYGLGGLVDSVSGAFGGSGGLMGAIIGGALAYFTGGMSLAAGAALGASAGAYADTGDLGTAAQAGAAGYGAGTAGAGIASGTGAGMAQGAATIGKLAASQPPVVPNIPQTPFTPQPAAGIPGSQPVRSNDDLRPSLQQGLGSLSSFDQPQTHLASSLPTLGEGDLSPIDAYYQCVNENGADNCQMPPEMMNQNNPLTIPTAQYAQPFQQGGAVNAPGTETSDSQPAWLSDNEFVMTADAVRGLGNGNVDLGANRMYDIMAQLEQRGNF